MTLSNLRIVLGVRSVSKDSTKIANRQVRQNFQERYYRRRISRDDGISDN